MILGVTALAGNISRIRATSTPLIVSTSLWVHYNIADRGSYPGSGVRIYDISGNGNTRLDFVGSPTYDTTNGIPSIQINAPDGNYLTSAGNLGISGSNSRSFEVWAYVSQSDAYTNVMGLGVGSNSAMMDTLVTNTGGFYRAQGHYYGVDNSSTWPSSTTINNGAWNQIVHTYDSSKTFMYVNGVQQGSGYTVALNTTDNKLHVGWGNYSAVDIFTGRIGNVKVYKDYALSGAEALQNYNALKASYGLS
jgi:hypothetical protein